MDRTMSQKREKLNLDAKVEKPSRQINPVCSQTFGDFLSFYSFPRVKSPKDKLNIYSVLTYSPFSTPAPSLSALPAVTDRSAVISQHIKFC